MTVLPQDGRIGDVWRVEGKDHLMRITRLNKYSLGLNSVEQPQPSSWGYDRDRWEDQLYRVREDLDTAQIGDIVHLYVPPTDVYLLGITLDPSYPALSGWFGYQAGREPNPDDDEAGVFFHPSADENLVVELLWRPRTAGRIAEDEVEQWRRYAGVGPEVFGVTADRS